MSIFTAANHKLYYIAETVPGTTPTTPSFLWLGVVTETSPSHDPATIKIPAVGTPDLAYIRLGHKKPKIEFTYTYETSAFLKLALARTSFTLEDQMISPDDSTVYYMRYRGCIVDSAQVSAKVDGNVEVKISCEAISIDATRTMVSGATYASDAGSPKAWYDTVVTISSALDVVSDWDFTIKNTLQRYPVIPATAGIAGAFSKYIVPRARAFTGNIKLAYLASMESFLDACFADSDNAVTVTIGTDSYAFTGMRYDTNKLDKKAPAEVVTNSMPWTARALTISP